MARAGARWCTLTAMGTPRRRCSERQDRPSVGSLGDADLAAGAARSAPWTRSPRCSPPPACDRGARRTGLRPRAAGVGVYDAAASSWPSAGPARTWCPCPVADPTGEPRRAGRLRRAGARARAGGRRRSWGAAEAALGLWEQLRDLWPAGPRGACDQPSHGHRARRRSCAPDPRVRRSVPDETSSSCCPRASRCSPRRSATRRSRPGGPPTGRGCGPSSRRGARSSDSCPTAAGGPPVGFKAELGAVAGGVAQVQGVWVEPAFRGRGCPSRGMAAVVATRARRRADGVAVRQRLQRPGRRPTAGWASGRSGRSRPCCSRRPVTRAEWPGLS